MLTYYASKSLRLFSYNGLIFPTVDKLLYSSVSANSTKTLIKIANTKKNECYKAVAKYVAAYFITTFMK